MESVELSVHTGDVERVVDLTSRCAQFLADVGAGDGLLNVFVPHATAGVAVIETGAGSDDDLLAALRELLPPAGPGGQRLAAPARLARARPRPRAAGLVPPYATLPVLGGQLALGTWQSVVLVDTNVDNPDRRVRLSFLAG